MKKYLPVFAFSFIITITHAQIFHENFDAPSLDDSVSSYSSNLSNTGWNLNNHLQVSPNNCDSAYLGNSDTVILTTAAFSTIGYSTIILSFNHICKNHFFDQAIVEASSDNGITWQQLCSEYIGYAVFLPAGCNFSAASYEDWFPTINDTIPDNTWWKKEAFDLSSTLNNTPNAMIRFVLTDIFNDLTDTLNGWMIDDILVDDHYIGNSDVNSIFNPCGGLPQTVYFELGASAYGYLPADSLNVHFFFGDGTDTTYSSSCQTTGFHDFISHDYTMPGIYSTQAIFYSAIGINDTITQINSVLLTDTCGNIEGRLFIDYNADCIFNGTDETLKHKFVRLLKSGQPVGIAISDYSGNYSFFNMPLDTYSVSIDTTYWSYSTANLNLICPASGNYTVTNVPSAGNDFAFDCNNGMDLYASINAWHVMPGISSAIYPFFGAVSCQALNGQGTLILDPLTALVFSNPPPDVISGDTLIWNFTNVNLNYPFIPEVNILPDAILNIGDDVCFTVIIQPFAGDSDTLNNTDYDCAEMVNSFDPNNKSVSPEGAISSSQDLNYVINFQNTGNAFAYNVYVVDTISPHLDLTTLRINSASHNMSVDILNNNVLKFNFNNIMLPDSNANEPASHGFINYSIQPVSNLPDGTVILNTAHIYFDFNLPVTTNTTLNMIDSTIATGNYNVPVSQYPYDIKIVPNPVKDWLNVQLSNSSERVHSDNFQNKKAEIKITDVLGKEIFSRQFSIPIAIGTNLQIPTSEFQSGIYFVIIKQHGTAVKNFKFVKY